MAIQIAALVAAFAMAEKFLDCSLVKRLLTNASKATTNKFDDFIIGILYGTPEEQIPAKLAEAQQSYDSVPSETREAMKDEPSSIPPEQIKQALAAVNFPPESD